MVPPGVETRSHLCVRDDVLAFGFSSEQADADSAVQILCGALLDHIRAAVEKSPTRFVVVDWRQVKYMTAIGLGHLKALHGELKRTAWKLVLLIGDPMLRAVLSTTHLDQVVSVVSSEEQLRNLVNRRDSDEQERALAFTREELAAMDAAGLTLDDAIRSVERLRG